MVKKKKAYKRKAKKPKIQTENQHEITCPYCGWHENAEFWPEDFEIRDACDKGCCFEAVCPKCGEEFEVKRSIGYTTTKKVIAVPPR